MEMKDISTPILSDYEIASKLCECIDSKVGTSRN